MREPYEVIVKPVVTEKSMRLIDEENVYTFFVAEESSKPEIAEAIEHLWDVRVVKVRTMRYAGKRRRALMGRLSWNPHVGRRSDFKKALVELVEGDHIEFYEVG